MDKLFRAFKDSMPVYTGYNFEQMVRNWEPGQHIFECIGIKDADNVNIYRGDIVLYTRNMDYKAFTGVVDFIPQLSMYVIFDRRKQNYVELYRVGTHELNGEIVSTNLQLVGNSFTRPEIGLFSQFVIKS